jgi:hypothetical protein
VTRPHAIVACCVRFEPVRLRVTCVHCTVVIYMKTGSQYCWGAKEWRDLVEAGWLTLDFDTAAPDLGASGDFDPRLPVVLGVRIGSGSVSAGVAFGAPVDTVSYIDQISTVPNTCR